jgi:hypothetical protein
MLCSRCSVTGAKQPVIPLTVAVAVVVVAQGMSWFHASAFAKALQIVVPSKSIERVDIDSAGETIVVLVAEHVHRTCRAACAALSRCLRIEEHARETQPPGSSLQAFRWAQRKPTMTVDRSPMVVTPQGKCHCWVIDGRWRSCLKSTKVRHRQRVVKMLTVRVREFPRSRAIAVSDRSMERLSALERGLVQSDRIVGCSSDEPLGAAAAQRTAVLE